jgi:predicted nucleotidyltransferase
MLNEGRFMPTEVFTLQDYRAKAVECSRKVSAELERLGVRVVVTGSLARGGFDRSSDVDFVVLECPDRLRYAIEGIVEDGLDGIPFDVIYQDEIPEHKRPRFLKGALLASELR